MCLTQGSNLSDNFFYNSRAKETLASFLGDGRFPHALLLEGNDGTGKKHFALAMAQALVCRGSGTKPCGECSQCLKAAHGSHPDIIVHGNEGGKSSFHIDTVREICRDTYILPNEAEYKIYILLNAQNMTAQAQNSLLKSLEEPPAHVVFILTCLCRRTLLPTIISRLQIVPIETPTVPQIVEALAEIIPQSDSEARMAAAEAGGSIGKALELLRDPERAKILAVSKDVLEKMLVGSEYDLQKALAAVGKKREQLMELLELLKARCTWLLTDGYRSGFAMATPLQLMRIIDIIDRTYAQTRQNGNVSLLITAFAARVKSAPK